MDVWFIGSPHDYAPTSGEITRVYDYLVGAVISLDP